MEPKLIFFALVTFFHDLFTVIWIGGVLLAGLSFMPAVKEALGPGPQLKRVMHTYQKRQSVWVYASMIGLILTGLLLSKRSPQFSGLFGFGNAYTAVLTFKHVLVMLMIGVSLYRSLAFRNTPAGAAPQQERLNARLLLVNMLLSGAVLLTSAFVAALAVSPGG